RAIRYFGQIMYNPIGLTRNPASANLHVVECSTQRAEKAQRLRERQTPPGGAKGENRRTSMKGFVRARSLGRTMLAGGLAAALMSSTVLAQSVDLSKWSPEYVRSIAGTEEFDTVGHCNTVVPTDYKGKLTFWYQEISAAEPEIMRKNYADFFAAFREA